MHILAHRGYLTGADPDRENRPAALAECLARGYGIETDLRRSGDGRFYISHDPAEVTADNLADHYCEAFRSAAAPIALNLKELGYEQALIDYLVAQKLIGRVFLFDMELIERTPGEAAEALRQLHPTVPIAARVSDRGESVDRALGITAASIIWLDEFDRLWAQRSDVERLKQAGKVIHAVSPELHGFPLEVAMLRWDDFRAWGVDGVCTDFPEIFEAWYKGHRRP